MKINAAAAYQYYKAYMPSSAGEQQVSAVRRETPGKTDVVSISGDASQRSPLARLAQDISAQLETSVSPSRIQSLRTAIENNEYRIPSEVLADSMLNVLG